MLPNINRSRRAASTWVMEPIGKFTGWLCDNGAKEGVSAIIGFVVVDTYFRLLLRHIDRCPYSVFRQR